MEVNYFSLAILLIQILMFFCIPSYDIIFLFFISMFHGSAFLIFPTFAVPLFYASCIIFIAFNIFNFRIKKMSYIFIFAFVIILMQTIFSTTIFFPGLNIQTPKEMTNISLKIPLVFSNSNLAQLIYFFLNITVSYLIYTKKIVDIKTNKMSKILFIIFFIVLLFAIVQNIFSLNGNLITNYIFYSNKFYDNLCSFTFYRRTCGFFTEPSFLSPVISIILYYAFINLYQKKSAFSKFVYFLLIILTIRVAFTSSSSTFILVLPIIFLLLRRYFDLKTYFIYTIGVFLLFLIVYNTDFFQNNILQKANSESFSVRNFSDLTAIQSTIDTYLFGTGLGSMRGSSLLTTILSNLGLVGIIFLFLLTFNITKVYLRKSSPTTKIISGFCLIVISSMSFSLPDLSYPFFWGCIFLLLSNINNSANLKGT